jgi:hypothetical protein
LRERGELGFRPGIVFVAPDEHTDTPNALALLRRPQARPRRGTAKPCYEIAPSHPCSPALILGSRM